MPDSFDAPVQSLDLQALRRQARQRFVGAAVLVLIALIVLPLLLDSRPRPISANIAIELQVPPNMPPAVVIAPLQAPPTMPPAAVATAPLQTEASVAPAAAAIVPETPTVIESAGYQVQAGSFTDKNKLAIQQSKLSRAGFEHYTQVATAKDGVTHTRLRLGPFATQVEANQVAARIGKLGIKTIVLKP